MTEDDIIKLEGIPEDSIITMVDYKTQSRLYISNHLTVEFTQKDIPNIWWRLWHFVFFGFKWEKVQ